MNPNQFMVGPIPEGLRKDVKAFAIPENAWERLINASQYRGRLIKRSGYTSLGQQLPNATPVMGLPTRNVLALNPLNNTKQLIAFDTTNSYFYDNGSDSFLALPSVMPVIWSGTDYQFFYTVNYSGALWTTNSKDGLNGWNVSDFAASVGVGNAATVQVTSVGNNVQVGDYVYFINLDSSVSANAAVLAQVTIAGNPFTVTATKQLSTSTFTWTDGGTSHGMVLDSMQTITGQDGIRYYGDLSNGNGWANYNPPIDQNTVLAGALLIFPYRGYLVFLNTNEGNDQGVFNFSNRARWTQIGTPYYSPPAPITPSTQTTDILAMRDDIFGRGGANDAPTQEAIIGAAFVRDILIVYFEQSTWRLRFVNNTQNPFVWERVNVELGSDCTFSTIPFDKGIMSISTRGIVISDTNDVVRIDQKIPDDIFTIRQSNNGLNRVYGIRTFRTRQLYWTFPSSTINPSGTYPDLVLVYNYETQNWSYYDDTFTCFGYFQPGGAGDTWNDLDQPWTTYGDLTCVDGITQEGYETIVAGNQQGFIFMLEQTTGSNAPSLSITGISGNLITVVNHNLQTGYWIKINGVTGITSIDGILVNDRNFQVNVVDSNTINVSEFEFAYGGIANGATYTNQVNFLPILPGSVYIYIGTSIYSDVNLDGNLIDTVNNNGTGTINYSTGLISIIFTAPVSSLTSWIRVVSVDTEQTVDLVTFTGAYAGGGLISRISGIDIRSKIFNFMEKDKRSRISKIDFYTNLTANGQFTCNVLGDSGNISLNTPLNDNPQSNVVLTTLNPYQIPSGEQTIYRLFCDAIAQTLQIQLTFSDQQIAVDSISNSNIEILSMMINMRQGGRIV